MDKQSLENGQVVPYQVFSVPLDAALDGVSIASKRETSGLMTIMAIGTDGIMDTISIKLNTPQASAISPKYVNPIPLPFYSFYVTSSVAQAGKTLFVLCANTNNPNFGTGNTAKALVSGAPQTIYSAALLAAGTYYTTMVDCRTSKRIALRIENGLDADATARALANITNASADADLINGDVLVPAGEHRTITIDLNEDWQPYIGVRLVVAAVPTAGTLTVYSVVQE
jgi:hypothetical protein